MCKAEIEKPADNTFASIDEFAYTKPTKLPSASPTLEQCAKTVWLARRSEEERHRGAAWKRSVHNIVLDLALHHDIFKEKVYFLN